MAESNPSASKYWLARVCLHPWTSGLAWPVRKTSYSARLGSYAHRKIECRVERTPDDTGAGQAWGATPRMRAMAAACAESASIYLGGLESDTARAEVAWRVSLGITTAGTAGTPPAPLNSTELFLAEPRAYPPLPGLYGTADLVAEPRPGTGGGGEGPVQPHLLVADWKTGMAKAPYTEHARWQLRWLGVAASKAMPELPRTVTLDACYLSKEGRRPWVQREFFTRDTKEWAAVEADVHRTLTRLTGPPEGPQPGPHCKLCPVREQCPEAI